MKSLIRLAILTTIIALFLIPHDAPTSAQTDSDWSVTIYDHGWNVLIELSPSGSQVTYLPDLGFPQAPYEHTWLFWYLYPRVVVTDDQRYVVALVRPEGSGMSDAVVTDLVTNETYTVPAPPMPENEFFLGYSNGQIDASQTQIALPYVSHDRILGGGCCNSGGIATADLATGNLIHTLDIETIHTYPATAWVDRWTDEGIWFAPTCSTCTPPPTYNYRIWNPETDTITPTTNFNDYQQAERLDATAEVLYSASHPDFPVGGESFPILLNSVTYHPPNTFDPSEYGQVIFYDTDFWGFDFRAHWVINGQAFLVTKDLLHNRVVMRDGQQLAIDYGTPEHFIAMTGDGWLTLNEAANTIQRYTVENDTIGHETIFQVSGAIEVANIQLPPLSDELAPYEIDIAPPEDVVFCPSAMPTQFEAGDWAETIVDHRTAAIAGFGVGGGDLLDADWRRGELLPLGTRVQVIEGPKCTPNGWAYVRVNYQGQIGWMLEVWQTTYYLALASPPK